MRQGHGMRRWWRAGSNAYSYREATVATEQYRVIRLPGEHAAVSTVPPPQFQNTHTSQR